MQKQSAILHVKKPTRSIAGVTPLTVVVRPRKCNHGTCIYCPGGDIVPQSYTDKSPAIMRAMALNYNPYKQVKTRLQTLKKMNHPTEKIEIIVLGGTFLQYSKKYKYEFIKSCYDALNGKKSKTLEQAQKLNEKAEHRIVALCIENRPDNCTEKDIKEMREFGCTRVELGVQILDDEIYKKISRGHTVQDVVDATKKLKDAGFKIGYHIMPGLPGSNMENDLKKFKIVFSDERFRPDQLKIYPCQIVKYSPLYFAYNKIKYKSYNEKQNREIIEKMMRSIPRYTRVMRIMREIPSLYTVQGVKKLDVRKQMEKDFRNDGKKLKEIRFREIGFALRHKDFIDTNLKLKITKYRASQDEEYFLEIVNRQDILFALLRLRIYGGSTFSTTTPRESALQKTDKNDNTKTDNLDLNLIKNFRNRRATLERGNLKNKKAFIRELHVYGQALKLGETPDGFNCASQHRGLGRWLMEEAEKIVKNKEIEKIFVISGVGVREYYRKLGYNLSNKEGGSYMVKSI